ncbi:hypothetical protein FCV25MIE_33697 [Fagus crenata]
MRRHRQTPPGSDDDREASEPTKVNNPIATAPALPDTEDGVQSGGVDVSNTGGADFVEGITLDESTAVRGDDHIPLITELSSQESNPVYVDFETKLLESRFVEENVPIRVQPVLYSNEGHAQLNVLSSVTTPADMGMESYEGSVGPPKAARWKKRARALSVQEVDHGHGLRRRGKRSLEVYEDNVGATEEPSLKKRLIVGQAGNHSSVEAVEQPHRAQ